MGPTVMNPGLAYVRLGWPTHPSRKKLKRPVLDNLTLHFAYDNISVKKTWVTLF